MKSAEFKGRDVTLTISSLKLEDLAVEGGGTKAKPIIGFAERPKLWVLNRTNSECLKAMFGRETDNWLGKRVTLFPAPFTDPFTGEQGTAIRVRGSPDIEKDMTIEIHLPRKKPMRAKMIKTGPAKNGAAPPTPPEPPPPFDDSDMPPEAA